MAPFAPWERAPRLAVAVSGGRDSMALALLAHRWARVHGGTILGLTVDHGLRPEAAAEAERVAAWLAARGIAHRTLRHAGPPPARGIQAAARALRHGLLEAACRAEGILHLLLGHQRDDQAETVLLRRAAGSGADGLAGMAAVRETAGPRLLRPLLGVPRARLAATLAATGQPWIDDPSNDDRRFARGRLRAGLAAADVAAAITAATLAGRARADAERAAADLAAACVTVAGAGCVLIDPAGLAGASDGGRRLVIGALRAVGGAPYPPREARLAPLLAAVAAGLPRGRTLAGCRVLRGRGAVLVCRAPAAAGPAVAFDATGRARWDDRFVLRVAPPSPAGWRVGALGARRPTAIDDVPAPARPTLPAVWADGTVVALPTCGWRRSSDVPPVDVVFAPRQALAAGPFAVV
ncbi:MAG: tRNA lysidine(34) synthetase TilS [Alphaproteobacteria bacterium]|nr:tRNA lysidine(34) synthetase TilS [Alphaproteobacteria bacterium]